MNGSETMAAHLGHQSAPSARPNLAELVNAALRSRRRVFLLGFELRLPLDMPASDDDGAVEAFLKTLNGKFGPEGLDLDLRHVWYRPQEEGKKPCFRCVLVLNGGRLGIPTASGSSSRRRGTRCWGFRIPPTTGSSAMAASVTKAASCCGATTCALTPRSSAAWPGWSGGTSEGGVESRREPITVPVGSKARAGGGTSRPCRPPGMRQRAKRVRRCWLWLCRGDAPPCAPSGRSVFDLFDG